jgi:hypothetical protein
MAETDPEKLADRLEDEADDLERRSRKLGQETEDVAQAWERKRSDEGVPGAPPPVGDEETDKDEDEPPTGAPSGKSDEGD